MAKQKIAKLADIKHLRDRGSLIKFTYDTEIYNLDKTFPGIYDFGALIEDLAGNEIGAPVHYLKQPKDSLHSIVSNLITRSFPEDHPDAVDFKTFTGKIAHTLDRFYEYTWERYRDEEKIKYVNKGHQKVNEETVRLFPVEDENGNIQHIRLHEGGRRISYQVPDHSEDWNYIQEDENGKKTKWRKPYASAEMRGYANTTADDPWIWSTLYMACFPEIYKTHTKNEHKFRQDLFPAMVGHILWGDKGENGLKPGSRYHPVKGKNVISLKQSDFIPANARNEGPFHERGVHLRDGSDYDPDQAHGTIADVRGTSASENRARDVNPEIAKHFELMADPAYARQFIMKGAASERNGFRDRPLLAFGRYNLEDGLTSHLGICIETDERYGNRSNAIMLKVDADWNNVCDDKGRSILDIKHKATLKKLIKSHIFNKFGKSDSLLEITHTKKTPKVYDGEKALKSGAHTQEQYNLALRNAGKIRKNANFREAIMEVYQEGIPQMKALMDRPNPLDDELKDNFTGKPNYFEIADQNGKIRVIDERNEVYEHALNEWNTALNNDHLLHNLIRPHAIEWCSESEAEQELERFNKVLAKVRSEFEGTKGYNNRENRGANERPPIIIPPVKVTDQNDSGNDDGSLSRIFAQEAQMTELKKPMTQAQAQAYITQLRFQALWADYNDDPSFRFNDNSWRVEIIDRDGQVMNWHAYHALTGKDRSDKWKNGDIDIRLQPIDGLSVRRIARMMYESGELEQLINNFADLAKNCDLETEEGLATKDDYIEKIKCLYQHKELYEARCAFMLHGYPNINPEKQPFLTIDKAKIQAHEILQNLKIGKLHQCGIDDIGALEFMADHKDEAEKVLTRYLAYLDQKAKDVPPPTPEQYRMLGIDPVSGDAMPFIKYNVDPQKIVEITCPDGHAQTPLSHDDIGSMFTIIELPKGMNAAKLSKALEKSDNDLVMVGETTGERRLAAKAKILALWPEEEDQYFQNELDYFNKSYQDIDKAPPKDRTRLAIVKMEDNPPVAGLRGDGNFVNTNLQTLHIPDTPSRKTFMGILNRKLGIVQEEITGLIVRSDDLKQPIEKGQIRIREMAGSSLTGREIEHTVTKSMTFNMKRVMSAFTLLEETPDLDITNLSLEQARDAGFSDKAEMAQYITAFHAHTRYGYTSKLDMYDSLIAMFTKNRQNVMQAPEKYNLTVVDLKKDVNLSDLKNTMVYFDLYNRPKASISESVTLGRNIDRENTPYLYSGAYPGKEPSLDQ